MDSQCSFCAVARPRGVLRNLRRFGPLQCSYDIGITPHAALFSKCLGLFLYGPTIIHGWLDSRCRAMQETVFSIHIKQRTGKTLLFR